MGPFTSMAAPFASQWVELGNKEAPHDERLPPTTQLQSWPHGVMDLLAQPGRP